MRVSFKKNTIMAAVLPALFLGCCGIPKLFREAPEPAVIMTAPKPCPPCPPAPPCPEAKPEAKKAAPAPEDVFKDIHFDHNQYYFTPVAESQLKMLAKYLKENSSIRILIAGNCGTFGTEAYNKELGAQRAFATKSFLVANGIAEDRLDTVSYGKDRPIASGCGNHRCNAVNRRVEFTIVQGSGEMRLPSEQTEIQSSEKALMPVYFDFDQSYLEPDAEAQLDILAFYMKAHPEIRIRIAGNCGTIGGEAANNKLGEERAYSAMSYLISSEIPRNRLEIVSYGKDRPAVKDCADERCNVKNRRDEFSIIK